MRATFLVACLLIVGCSGNPDPKSAKVDRKVSASDLCSEYVADSKGAEKKNFGKMMEITGTAQAVHGHELHIRSGYGQDIFVACFFQKEEYRKALKRVSAGDAVTVRGTSQAFLSSDGKSWLCVFDSMIVE